MLVGMERYNMTVLICIFLKNNVEHFLFTNTTKNLNIFFDKMSIQILHSFLYRIALLFIIEL